MPALPRYTRHFGLILHQAWPVLISSWAGLIFGVLDTAMAGHASALDLQIMALAASIYVTVFVGLIGVVHALIPIVAQHFGAKRYADVGQAWGQGVWLAAGLSVAGGATMLFPDVWLRFSGDIDPQVRAGITWYLRALVLALPAMLMFRTVYALGTAVSRPKVVMIINVISVGFKLLFNWIFIFGKFGFPALGAVGAGVATAVVGWMMVAAGWWVLHHDTYFRQFQPRLARPHWPSLRELLRLGLPMGGSYLVEICAFTFMALLVAREGMFVTGGHQIMANLAALCYMVPMAIGIASAALVAQAIGARDARQAKERGMAGLTIAMSAALLIALAVAWGREDIAGLYTNDAGVILVAAAFLQLLPWFHITDALQCMGCYLLRAYKIALVPLILQTVALSGVGLVGGWWLGFGPGAGTLAPILNAVAPGAPIGAGSMWLMALLGLLLSSILLFAWYGHILRRYPLGRASENGRAD